MFIDPVYQAGMRIVPIIAWFVQYVQHDQKETGHANGQADRIQEREGLVLSEASPGSFKVVFEHDQCIIFPTGIPDQRY